MKVIGVVAGSKTIPLRGVMSRLPDVVPALESALRNYTAAHAAVLPALHAPGGIAATLRMAPQLAVNMDAWMRDVGAVPLLPVRMCKQLTISMLLVVESALTVMWYARSGACAGFAGLGLRPPV